LEKPSATDFFNHVKIGEWKPAQIKGDFQAVEWSLGDRVKNTGEIEVVMLYKKGAKGIDIQSVALYEDGNEVAKDSHTGFSGAKLTNIAYKLKLNTFNPNAKYSIKAVIKGSAGTDSYGEVKLQVQ
jgi:hexosaminidase